MEKTVAVIMGTRPEAIKLCPVVRELRGREGVRTVVISTAQHGELLERAAACFGVRADERLPPEAQGRPLHAAVGRMTEGLGEVLSRLQPSLCVVQGDTASAFAGALAAFYCGVAVAHVEAGLRTYRIRSPFPEELHRQAIALLAELHFAPTAAAKRNLLRTGVAEKRIYLTGNTAIDALRFSLVECEQRSQCEETAGLGEGRMILFTAHRRESWGEPLREMLGALRRILETYPDTYAVCPLHPNPEVRRTAEEVLNGCPRVQISEPQEFTTFHRLLARAHLVLTDSGGIQEETTALGIPTLVMRYATERVEGVRAGVLRPVGTGGEGIFRAACELLADGSETYAAMRRPSGAYGDGHAARRIARILDGWLANH